MTISIFKKVLVLQPSEYYWGLKKKFLPELAWLFYVSFGEGKNICMFLKFHGREKGPLSLSLDMWIYARTCDINGV